MKINTLIVKNFKGFDNREFTFERNFTVLIGDNATGKTSILDALAVAAGSFFLGLEGISPRNIEESEIRIKTIDGQPKPQKPSTVVATGVFVNEEQPITWKREIINQNTTSKSAKKVRDLARNMLAMSREGQRIIFPLVAYHGTGRLAAQHEKIGFQKQEEGISLAYKNSLSTKSSSKEFLSWYKTQEDQVRKFEDDLEIAHLTAFKETILSMVPELKWQDIAYDNKREEMMGIFTDSQGQKHKLSFQQLSDGYRIIIGLAADLAYRSIQLNPHLKERAVVETPGIVLIDELDLHLHPNWQKRVVADLKRTFPRLQFVATTHSPFIVQSLEESELINLEGEGLEGSPQDYGIEDVAELEMGVEKVARSKDFIEREEIAARYFSLIKEGQTSENNEEVARLRAELNKLEERFSEDPAFVASLKIERKAAKL